MLILTHPNNNRHHGKPVDWDDERDGVCNSLPTVTVGALHASYWQPEPDELALLVAGGSIRLGVLADQHPVVSLSVQPWPLLEE